MASKLEELTGQLQAKSAEIHAILDEAGPDLDMDKVTKITGDSSAKVAEIRRLKAEEDDLAKQVDELGELDGYKATSAERMTRKSAGTKVGLDEPTDEVGAPVFNLKAALKEAEPRIAAVTSRTAKSAVLFKIDDPESAWTFLSGAKATITLSDISPVATRRPAILPSAQARIFVSDMMAQGTTDGNTLTYMEETTFTNAAVETAENVAKPESTLDFTERTDNVRKIATWIPITDEALADNRQLRSYVEGRLIFMVQQREEQQLLVGDGTAPNISGILDRSGIQTQAKGADPTPDAFYKAITKVRFTGDAEPNGIVMHPNDWEPIRLLRTADGLYIWGNPSEEGPERLWGRQVRITTGITENTGLVGDFANFAQVFRREGLRVEASTEHASFFVENKVALLAETRLALAVYRPAAFCSVTGI